MRPIAFPRPARLCYGIFLVCLSSTALAAPFCLETQAVPPQCNYYDATQCQRDAARQGGVCNANPQQMTLQPGVGQYCVVTSGGASSCVYSDIATCMSVATRMGGACATAPQVAPSRAPDPYASINGQ